MRAVSPTVPSRQKRESFAPKHKKTVLRLRNSDSLTDFGPLGQLTQAVSPHTSAITSKSTGQVSRFPAERLGDAELVHATARGDAEAISVIWDRYAALVRSVLRGALGPDLVAEDLLQEVFTALVKGAKGIHEGAALRGYLVSVAVRLAALELRRRKVRRWIMLSSTGELPDTAVLPRDSEGRQALHALYRVLDRLGSRRRLAFVLRHIQGMGLDEVAAALGVSVSTARRELTRARLLVSKSGHHDPALHAYVARFRRVDGVAR
jgi:RNA polymerase sigma-70 factor, ECF subfamily